MFRLLLIALDARFQQKRQVGSYSCSLAALTHMAQYGVDWQTKLPGMMLMPA